MSELKPRPTNDDCKAWLLATANDREVGVKTLCALMCLSYKGTGLGAPAGWLPVGWTLVASVNNERGYDAYALMHDPSRTLVFVNRGVEGARSVRDWKEALRMTNGQGAGTPMQDAVEFFVQVARDHGAAIAEYCATGHSMGAGLAEGQIGLGPSACRKAGVDLNAPGFGVGFASASFHSAIRSLARSEGLSIEADMEIKLTHYVRRHDAINDQPNRDLFGNVIAPASVFAPRQSPAPRGHGQYYERAPNEMESHDRYLYFGYYEVPDTSHIFRRRGDLFEVRPGGWPKPYSGRPPVIPQADA
jgi:hypothetical protein